MWSFFLASQGLKEIDRSCVVQLSVEKLPSEFKKFFLFLSFFLQVDQHG